MKNNSQTTKLEVRTKYSADNFPSFDDVLFNAVGRPSDFSGMGFGERDHGWFCGSEIEQHKIKSAIKKLGLTPEVRP